MTRTTRHGLLALLALLACVAPAAAQEKLPPGAKLAKIERIPTASR